ncbi:MAG: helix-turn-helix domain-containing protein [Candidatus Aminicenantales bacterium]
MKELITLSRREAQRMQVLEQVIRKALSLKEGARLMKVCYRQAKRLLARYRREGPKGLAHRRRGRAAPNAIGPEVRERVLALHREVYSQFNDTHFVEMLEEREHLRIGRETVRRWLREAGIRPRRRRRPHQRGETRSTSHILQVYYETTPAPNPGGHFSLAVEGTS